jgi:hypothetical protein
MQIKPLGRSRFKPVTLLVPKWRELVAYTPSGIKKAKGAGACYDLLKSLEMHNLYVSHTLKDLLNTTGSHMWQAEMWKGHVTTMSLDGTKVKVHSLRRILDDFDGDEQKYLAFLELAEWLHDWGVAPGSISAMAWNLWRSTLDQEFSLSFNSQIGRQSFYGGRQEATPGQTYSDFIAVDISSAYPYEMARRPYAGTLREVSPRTPLEPEIAGIAQARVFVPNDLPHSPLPTRSGNESLAWSKGWIEGSWTWSELSAAKSLGCKVEVSRCWAPLTEVQPFEKWWEVVREGRATLSPAAAKLVKSLSNSLWGMFGMTGDDRGVVRWTDQLGNSPEMVQKRSKSLPQSNTAHIAAETTSRVRVRMLLEGLYSPSDLSPNNPVHVDTDGVIIPREALKSFNEMMIGNKSGQWRIKTVMKVIEVRAPQLYRYKTETTTTWQYVASGMTGKQAEELFKRNPQGFGVSLLPNVSQTL